VSAGRRGPESLEQVVLMELGDHLESADRLAAAYAREYVRAMREGRRVRPPAGLHPDIARLVRDVALDAMALERLAA
jgi:hypothetical protein